MDQFILDTNVPLIAENNNHLSLSCKEKCINIIELLFANSYQLVIDSDYILLSEYMSQIKGNSQFNFANRFLKWVLTNQANETLVKTVKINKIAEFEFAEISSEIKDIQIDKSDLKFIAVSVANNYQAPIIQASDSKWLKWEDQLLSAGVATSFPCRDELSVILNHKKR